jgi:hypothetical protein
MLDSGQFLLADDRMEVDFVRFKTLVDRVIGVYNGYSPVDFHEFIKIVGGRQYKFTKSNTKYGQVPKKISDLIPIRILGAVPYGFQLNQSLNFQYMEKGMMPYDYRLSIDGNEGILTVPFNADFDCHAIYNHELVKTGKDPQSWDVKTLGDNDDEFIDLLVAKFLIAVGRSRRAFTLNDLPITTDAAELVSEGKELEDKAMQDLIDNKMKWYLAW